MASSDSSWSNEYGGDSGGGCFNSFFESRQRKRARLSSPAASATAVSSSSNGGGTISSDAIVNGSGGGGTYSDLVKEMNKLSVEEREKVYNDVHGVSDIQEETPQFVQRCLDEMDTIIASIPTKKRRTYNRAMFLYPGLIHDNKFKLMFLRADEFDPEKAARRMLKYYDQKHIIFGEGKLVKEPITLSDLNDEEISILKNGFMSEVPVKDQSGRSVFLTNMSQMKFDCCWQTDSVIRGFWYILMNFMDDELNQRKGICIVMNCITELLKHPNAISFCSELAMKTGYLTSYCLPLRFTSLHFCYDDSRMEFFTNIIRMAIGRGRSLRLRCHLGSQVENQYSLMTFGICYDSLLQPCGENNGSTYYHGNEDRVEQRLQIDQDNDKTNDEECMKFGFISYPGPNDVLIGRGRPYRDYPCNACWNDIINSNVDRYRTASSRTEKMAVTRDVTKLVQDSKIRFLLEKRDNDDDNDDGKLLWKVLDPNNIREKVSVALQNKAKIITRMETSATTTTTQTQQQQQQQQDHHQSNNNNLMSTTTTTIAINADPIIATGQQQQPSFLFGDPFS